ncbi:hypothetical protein [Rhizobium sp. 768_B6_N1_8]|uniref:hypothetical protein n=1 Tax=unclassified Rhizobium TaxID=2613769 RepID=UPI003F2075CC
MIISSNAKGVAPLFSSFEYNAKGNARTMHSSHGRFIKSSAVRKTGEKLGIYQDLARGGFLSILTSRTKDEQVIISCPGDGSNSARAGDRRTAKRKGPDRSGPH